MIERTYDYVIASRSFQGEIRNMEVVADFESRPQGSPFRGGRKQRIPRKLIQLEMVSLETLYQLPKA